MVKEKQMNYKLRAAREQKHWSMEAAAVAVSVSKTTFLRWENGEQISHGSTLDMLCRAFHMSDEDLGYPRGKRETSPLAALLPEQETGVSYASGALFPEPFHSTQEVAPIPTAVDSVGVAMPDQTATLFAVDLWDSTLTERLSVRAFLLQRDAFVDTHKTSYDHMIQAVLVRAWQGRKVTDSLSAIQQFFFSSIRKYDAMHEDHTQKDVRMTRRNALLTIAQFPIQLYGLTLFASNRRVLPVPEEFLPLCAAGLAACHELRQYEHEGMQAIRRILSAYLPTLEQLVQQSPPHQKSAAQLASQSYLLAGVVANHYGKLDQMESASRLSRLYAQTAQDSNLEAAALIRLGTKFNLENQYPQMLKVYQEAQALPGFQSISPLLRGRIYAGLAGSHAFFQHSAETFSFLSQAKEIYPADPTSDPSYSIAISGSVSLASYEGMALEFTEHYPAAIAAYLRYGSLTPIPGVYENNRAEQLNYAASVAVKQRDLDAASLYLHTAEEIAWSIRHEQLQAQVRDTLRGMQLLWPHEPKVKALQEKMYERQPQV